MEVSVIMSAYQAEDYIAEAIESVLQQTYPHFELVLLDDCSTDRTFQIAKTFASQDNRLRLFQHPKNMGMVKTYNDLLQVARYDWVFVLDGDDRMLPERIERQMAFLQEHPDLVIMGAWVYYINANGNRIGKMMNPLTSHEKIRLQIEADQPLWLPSPTVAYQRLTALKMGGYRAVAPIMDTDLNTRLALIGPALWQPEFLGEYRIHAKSVSVGQHAYALKVQRWISAWLRARRLGQPEADLVSYLASENNLPFLARLRLALRDRSAVYYKQAVVAYSNQNYLWAALFAALSLLFWPQFMLWKTRNRRLL